MWSLLRNRRMETRNLLVKLRIEMTLTMLKTKVKPPIAVSWVMHCRVVVDLFFTMTLKFLYQLTLLSFRKIMCVWYNRQNITLKKNDTINQLNKRHLVYFWKIWQLTHNYNLRLVSNGIFSSDIVGSLQIVYMGTSKLLGQHEEMLQDNRGEWWYFLLLHAKETGMRSGWG